MGNGTTTTILASAAPSTRHLRLHGTYDYTAPTTTQARCWQAHAGKLWRRFTIALRRKLAATAGLKVFEFKNHARLSYARAAEYQRLGVVHFHAVVRVDGSDGPHDPTPAWATAELLGDCIKSAARPVGIDTTWLDGSTLCSL
ncbi:replication initiator [Lentzea sp. NPDC006480]|uniref:replication initiator n=1 Tax=Lentzea sp. NPDC006480 TaxID=3157176 RepID=UPI0033BDB093